jgi:hypothetical protein
MWETKNRGVRNMAFFDRLCTKGLSKSRRFFLPAPWLWNAF